MVECQQCHEHVEGTLCHECVPPGSGKGAIPEGSPPGTAAPMCHECKGTGVNPAHKHPGS